MIDKYFTVVFKDLTREERVALLDAHPGKISASSYSHTMDDRDQLLEVLSYAECALGDIGDADREPGDDLEWCERRAAAALPRIRELLLTHGRTITTLTGRPQTPPPDLVEQLKDEALVGGIVPSDYVTRLITKSYASGWGKRGAVNEAELQEARDEELDAMLAELKELHLPSGYADRLRAAMRPKPPSLREQGLAALDVIETGALCSNDVIAVSTLRRVLKSLPQ